MNRFQIATQEVGYQPKSPYRVEKSIVHTSEQAGIHHSIFIPLHYEKNYAYPLVIWLHGEQDDERQLRRVMPLISMRNYVAVAPRGSCVADDKIGNNSWQQSDRGFETAEQSVFDCLEIIQEKYRINAQVIFLAGFQSGGTMAFRIALRRPDVFAGGLSIGGPFPSGNTPLANLENARALPLFIAHGRDSQSYPIQRACRELRLFHAAGLSVTLRQYPCGDELTTQMLSDMDSWLMEQVTGQSMSSEPSEHYRPDELN